LDPLVALAPQLVERLRSLKQLHEQADGFGDTLKVLTGEQSKLHAELRALTAQCTGLEKSFDENERGIQRNVERLDARTNDLFERIAKLSL
jgi:dynactin-2